MTGDPPGTEDVDLTSVIIPPLVALEGGVHLGNFPTGGVLFAAGKESSLLGVDKFVVDIGLVNLIGAGCIAEVVFCWWPGVKGSVGGTMETGFVKPSFGIVEACNTVSTLGLEEAAFLDFFGPAVLVAIFFLLLSFFLDTILTAGEEQKSLSSLASSE